MVRYLAGALAVAAALVSCSSAASRTAARSAPAASTAGSRTAAANERLAHYDDATVAFDYPGSWTPSTFTEVSSFSTSIVFMSTDRLRDPCATVRTATTTTISCGWPLTKLRDNGVLVQWSSHGFPGWTMSVAKGTDTTIAGRPAKVDVQSPGDCLHLGSAMTITAVISLAVPYNWYEMQACLAGPDPSVAAAQVNSMLHSTRLLRP